MSDEAMGKIVSLFIDGKDTVLHDKECLGETPKATSHMASAIRKQGVINA